MAVLVREDDGVRFALRPYREVINVKKSSLLQKEMSLLAQSHGRYACLFKQEGGQFEAVFAQEPGYLLGEAVWRYLGQPDQLIYCEALPNTSEIIVVVVQGRTIYLDAKLSPSELQEELASLSSVQGRFDIYTYGEVPTIGLSEGQIKSTTRLESSLFEALPVDPQIQLVPYELLITERLAGRSYIAWVIGGVLVLAFIAWWLRSLSPTEPVKVQQTSADPYAQYRADLSKASPTQQLTKLAEQINLLYGLPGWVATSIDYTSGSAKVALNSLGGSTHNLLKWAQQYGASVNLAAKGATLMIPVSAAPRSMIPEIRSLQNILALIIDKMMLVLPGKSIAISAITSQGTYSVASITVTVTDIAPYVLALIGRALSGLPVALTNSNLTMTNGLVSGTITLSALGI